MSCSGQAKEKAEERQQEGSETAEEKQRGPDTLPLRSILCFGKPSPDFLKGFPYLVSIQKLFFFVHMGYPQERPHSVRKLQINNPPHPPCLQTSPNLKERSLRRRSCSVLKAMNEFCIVLNAKEELVSLCT